MAHGLLEPLGDGAQPVTMRFELSKRAQCWIRGAWLSLALVTAVFRSTTPLSAASTASPPPLPAPTGTVVNVSTTAALQNAVANLASNTTIVLSPGTYNLSGPVYINRSVTNVGIRGATNNRDDVVIAGAGMNNNAVAFGLWTGGGVNGITIANLTIRDVYNHAIMLNEGTEYATDLQRTPGRRRAAVHQGQSRQQRRRRRQRRRRVPA